MKWLAPLLLLQCWIPSFASSLQDINATPGAINPNVTQDNIRETICASGWTKAIRPPSSYTTKLKIKQLRSNGPYHNDLGASYFEEDHLIPLELGGHPTDERNLFPQQWDGPNGAHEKDVLENRLKRLVCTGHVSLKEAQVAIATDWVTAYQKYVFDFRKRRKNDK